ncbi:MAG: hypothetical protein AB7V27_09500 [Candidatus Binatia bacterium]
MRRLGTVAVGLALSVTLMSAPIARAANTDGSDEWSDLGWGMAAIGTNIGYIPAKTIYALGSGLVAALAFGLTAGNGEVAKGILTPAFGGTWVVTPDMLQGEEPIMFSGPSYEPKA